MRVSGVPVLIEVPNAVHSLGVLQPNVVHSPGVLQPRLSR